MSGPTVTFDVFSALIDSRSGGTAFFERVAGPRPWAVSPTLVYDRWDAGNKRLHGRRAPWRPFAELAAEALAAVYGELKIDGDVPADTAGLLASMARWPLWPDVTLETLQRIGHPLGLLTNIDDALLAGTAPMQLGCFAPVLVLTSQRLQAYKPAPEFYVAAAREVGPIVHVASSARDVRGALEAGLPCVRLARSGHRVDPDGPPPPVTIDQLSDLPASLSSILSR